MTTYWRPGRAVSFRGIMLLLCGLLLGAAAACSSLPRPADVVPPPLVEDDDGVRVRLHGAPERIVALGPAQAELLLALGIEGELVASHELAPQTPLADTARLGGAPPDVEAVAAYRPDLVVAPPLPTAYRQALERRQLTVVTVHPTTAEEVPASLRLLGLATGRHGPADELAQDLAGRLEALKELAATRRRQAGGEVLAVYLEFDQRDGHVVAAAPGTFADSLFRAVGARNALAAVVSHRGEGLLPEERAVQSRPDVILAARPHVLTGMWTGSRAGWQDVPAVREGRLYTVEAAPFVRPGPRFPAAMEMLIGLLYDAP